MSASYALTNPARANPAHVTQEARRWIGTPHAHQHSAIGIGCDCLGLVRGVHEALTGQTVPVPPYGGEWDEALLWDGLGRHLSRSAQEAPGCVLIFSRRIGGPARHLGIQVAADRMVHCLERRGVREDQIGRQWRRRLVAVYEFGATD